MSRSELERLAEAIRALSDQIQRDAPSLSERQRHITRLAATIADIARTSNDRGLADVVKLTRLAGDRLADAIEQIAATGDHGRIYADHLVGSGQDNAGANGSGSASNEQSQIPGPPDTPGHKATPAPNSPHSDQSDRRLSRDERIERAKRLRRLSLESAGDIGQTFAEIVKPIYTPPQPPPGAEVEDPITALFVVTPLAWETIARWIKKSRGPDR